jgi:hypothetical protein
MKFTVGKWAVAAGGAHCRRRAEGRQGIEAPHRVQGRSAVADFDERTLPPADATANCRYPPDGNHVAATAIRRRRDP